MSWCRPTPTRLSTFRQRLKVAPSRGQPLSTGPTTSSSHSRAFRDLRKTRTLLRAWQTINRNAETSGSQTTRSKAREFAKDLPSNLRKIQSDLRNGYAFEKPFGATPPKGGGKKGNRPIVVASLRDRVVQRAILDTLQSENHFPKIAEILETPTSIGGIPGRGVDHAIRLFSASVKEGSQYVAGSDIGSFFTKIDQEEVLDFLRSAGVAEDFRNLIANALAVDLRNAGDLTNELRALFPTGTDGVAQGSPLSALAGNVVLREFDKKMNGRGIVCIRYIDDFLVCGPNKRSVSKAMKSAEALLDAKGMSIYDPTETPEKAFVGPIDSHHTFLGYQLIPGQFPPSTASCQKLLKNIDGELRNGRKSIARAVRGRDLKPTDRLLVQSLVQVDRIVRGWRQSHSMSNCPSIFEELDRQIDRRINSFMKYYRDQTAGKPTHARRLALGVKPL
ncbi:MAG: reverse transcriptase domain-containing protein [Pseudomonadota bacterium]